MVCSGGKAADWGHTSTWQHACKPAAVAVLLRMYLPAWAAHAGAPPALCSSNASTWACLLFSTSQPAAWVLGAAFLSRTHPAPSYLPPAQLSEALHAAQIVVEDHYLSNLHLRPLTVVGLEGVLGVVAMLAVVLPLAQHLPGADGKVGRVAPAGPAGPAGRVVAAEARHVRPGMPTAAAHLHSSSASIITACAQRLL